MKKLNKKGQLTNNLNMLAFGSIVFIVAVIVVVVGANIATTLKDNVERGSVAVDNESDDTNLLWGNNTNMTLNFDEVSVDVVYNCTGSVEIGEGNYTVFSDLGYIQCDFNASDSPSGPHNGDAICVNYTYLNDPSARNVSIQGEKGFLTFGDYFGVVATIIVLVVIVGLLIGVIILFQRTRT